MSAGLVDTRDEGAEVESLADDGSEHGGRGLHGDAGTLLHLVDGDLGLHETDHELGVADEAGDGHPDVIGDGIDLLDVAVGDEVAHCGPLVGRHDDSVLAFESERGGACVYGVFGFVVVAAHMEFLF